MKLFALSLVSVFLSVATFAHDAPSDGVLVFPQAAQHAHLHWVTPPNANQEAVLDMQWMNNSPHAPAEPNGTFTAQLWMPAMGHGSSPITIQHLNDAQGQPQPGAFRISKMYFIMDGAWEVRFTLTHADGTKETQAFAVNVGAGMADGAPEVDAQ